MHTGSRTDARLTEVSCTRIRLAPFCIRLSKKPRGGYRVRESVDNLGTRELDGGERERKRVLFAQRGYF